ncbi:MAG: fascin domain-containing protein, partial [Opitutaceae bacterium]
GMGEWETFRIHRLAGPGLISTGDAVSLQSVEQGNYWCAVNGGGGIVDVTRTGVGSWETFTITVDAETDKSLESVWIDINGDGVRDEVVRHGSQNFRFGIDYWDTYCYDYTWYPMGSSIYDYGYGWGSLWLYTTGFSDIFDPDLFWMYGSSYAYCETYIEPSISFETRTGQRYRVYQDTSGSSTFNPANWEEIITINNAGEGLTHVSLGTYYAEDFHLGQIFLVRLGGPPVGVAPENDYSWRWEEIPGYPAGRTWDGVTIHSDFPQWNWQNWPNNWWMTSPDDEDTTLDPYFGSGTGSREAFVEAEDLLAIAALQETHLLRQMPRTDVNTRVGAPGIGLAIFVVQMLYSMTEHLTFSYVVYEKTQSGTDRVYTGLTRGVGSPVEVVNRRDAAHWFLNHIQSYNGARINASISTQGFRPYAEAAIRGREQQVMDFHGGALSDLDRPYDGKLRASNRIRGVAKLNGSGYSFWKTSNDAFGGQVFRFTGSITWGIVIPRKDPQWIIYWIPPYYWPN